jgi:hypothetical protein
VSLQAFVGPRPLLQFHNSFNIENVIIRGYNWRGAVSNRKCNASNIDILNGAGIVILNMIII